MTIDIDPDAALEIVEARDYYEAQRPGLGGLFTVALDATLSVIDAAPRLFPKHPFATTGGVHRALFPPRWPYALAFLLSNGKPPYVLACEHLNRAPGYWSRRLSGRS